MRSSISRRPSARACALVSAVAIATLLSACGSDSDSSTDSSTDSTAVATSDAASDTTEPATDDTTEESPVDSGAVDSGPTAETATRDDYVAAFATNYAIFDDEQDECIGETFVTAIGEDQLTSSGLAPGDIRGAVLLADLGVSIDQETLPAAIEDLAGCGDLVTVSLASATATAEQTECATAIITNELAAEQLLVQVSGLEPSAELLAAREALNGCSAD